MSNIQNLLQQLQQEGFQPKPGFDDCFERNHTRVAVDDETLVVMTFEQEKEGCTGFLNSKSHLSGTLSTEKLHAIVETISQ